MAHTTIAKMQAALDAVAFPEVVATEGAAVRTAIQSAIDLARNVDEREIVPALRRTTRVETDGIEETVMLFDIVERFDALALGRALALGAAIARLSAAIDALPDEPLTYDADGYAVVPDSYEARRALDRVSSIAAMVGSDLVYLIVREAA